VTFVPAVNCAKINIQRGEIQTAPVWNTLWVQFPDAITSARLIALNTAIATWWVAYLKPLQWREAIWGYVQSTQQDDDAGLQETLYPVNIYVPSGPQFQLPGNCALVCTFHTGNTGRSRRGRFYLGNLDKSCTIDLGPSKVKYSYSLSYLAAFTALQGYLNTVSGAPVHAVVSHYADHIERDTALISPVTSYSCNLVLDSQRRRLREPF